MDSPAFVQVANDRMLPWLVASQESKARHCPDIQSYFFAFDEHSARAREVAALYGARETKLDLKKFDEMGRKVFGDSVHRGAALKRFYFRKLAAFTLPAKTFWLMDANCLILDSPLSLLRSFEASAHFAAFHSRAAAGRNFGASHLYEVLNLISPSLGWGYNFGCAFGRCDPEFVRAMEALAEAGLALGALLGSAPEQGFLNYALAVLGKPVALFNALNLNVATSFSASSEMMQQGPPMLFGSESPSPGKVVYFLKWNGARFDAGQPNFEIVKRYLRFAMERHGAPLESLLAGYELGL